MRDTKRRNPQEAEAALQFDFGKRGRPFEEQSEAATHGAAGKNASHVIQASKRRRAEGGNEEIAKTGAAALSVTINST